MKTAAHSARIRASCRIIAIVAVSYSLLVTVAGFEPSAVAQRPQKQYLDIPAKAAARGSFVEKIRWRALNPAETMKRQVEESPIIVVGQAVKNQSMVTAKRHGIVTYHEIFVLDVLKGNVARGERQIVVVPGGRVGFDDGSFAQWNLIRTALPEPGRRYLWFLERARANYIPIDETRGEIYEPANGPLGIWQLEGRSAYVTPLGGLRSPLALEIGEQHLVPAEFTNVIRDLARQTTPLADVVAGQGGQRATLTARQRDASAAIRGVWVESGRSADKRASLIDEPEDIFTEFLAKHHTEEQGPQSVEEQVRMSACRADAVIIGAPASRGSFLSDDAQYVVTEYKLEVKESLIGTIRPGSVIPYFRPGGAVNIRGRVVRAVSEWFPELELGVRYALFLRKVPGESTSYTVDSGEYSGWGADAIEMGDLAIGRSPWSLTELEEGVEVARVLDAIAAAGRCE